MYRRFQNSLLLYISISVNVKSSSRDTMKKEQPRTYTGTYLLPPPDDSLITLPDFTFVR